MRRQTLLQTSFRLRTQFVLLAAPLAAIIGRQDRVDGLDQVGAAAGDDQGIVDGFGKVGEQRPHFVGRLESVFGRQPPPIALRDVGSFSYANEGVVGLIHGRIGEEHFVGCDQRQVQFVGNIYETGFGSAFFVEPVAHDLDIDPARKDRRQPLQPLFGGRRLSVAQQTAERPAGASRQHDQPVRVFFQCLERHFRLMGFLVAQVGER